MRITTTKQILFFALLVQVALFSAKKLFAQNHYTLQIDSIHAIGEPGDFLLAPIKLTNTTNQGYSIKIHRLEKTIPETWSSCFCYPSCVAPWIDSLEWWVNAYETISIAPNFNTDFIEPGYGYVVIRIYETGYPEYSDTITCTGSTQGTTAVSPLGKKEIQLFPNPAGNSLHIDFDQSFSGTVRVLDQMGSIVVNTIVHNSLSFDYDITHLSSGCYLLHCSSDHEEMLLQRFVKK